MPVLGFVVAGGRSLRMGRDKALLPWGDVALIDHAIARLRRVCDEVRILSGEDDRYADRGLRVIRDALPGAGPLAGVLAGLEGLEHAAAGLFLAVDLPLVPVALLQRLTELSQGHDAAVPVTAEGAHPLCAVYRGACAEPIRRRLAAGERRMTCFWPDIVLCKVSETDLRDFGDVEALLRNLNRPEDYERLASGA
jgi:molybdopterin-guanine dinucleotide biosynthesis protein A